VAVLDKGRGSGGRLATRRAGDLRFDHGAQYIRPDDPDFAALLRRLGQAGAAAPWATVGADAWVGTPGMSALVKPLAAGLALHQEVEVAGLRREAGAWHLFGTDGAELARCATLVLTVPAPQAQRLLDGHGFAERLSRVVFAPCWTLMAAFETAPDLPDTLRDRSADLAWVARDGTRPGRETETWVAHASPGWSRANLERDREDVCAALVRMLGALAGSPLPAPTYAAAHRWRYSQAETPLGAPCLHDPAAGLVVAGDWCLGARAEHGWWSGQAALAALQPGAALVGGVASR
jgi:predicted NAD/FAD-dependent oxidoreductase